MHQNDESARRNQIDTLERIADKLNELYDAIPADPPRPPYEPRSGFDDWICVCWELNGQRKAASAAISVVRAEQSALYAAIRESRSA